MESPRKHSRRSALTRRSLGIYFDIDGASRRRALSPAPEVIDGIANGHSVLVLEGEGKVNRRRNLGLVATCNAFGASVKNHGIRQIFVRRADSAPNDDPGFEHIDKISTLLTGVAKSIRVLLLPDLPPKGDIIDWLAAGGTREPLDDLVNAPAWRPPPELRLKQAKMTKLKPGHEDELIAALAKMKGMEYGHQRKAAEENSASMPAILIAKLRPIVRASAMPRAAVLSLADNDLARAR